MSEETVSTVYFERPGPDNTARTLAIARERVGSLGLQTVVVATTTGKTGAAAAEVFAGLNVVVVTHSTGYGAPGAQELTDDFRRQIEAAGARILTTTHAFGGVGRAVRRKLDTYQVDEIIAYTLRTLGQGMKVVMEITAMAADAGLIPMDQEIIVIGGTGRGADTAAVIRPAHAQDFFDMRIVEVLCKPRLGLK
jgi:uncharacterized protein